jgi:phosphatidylserine decarboxylase
MRIAREALPFALGIAAAAVAGVVWLHPLTAVVSLPLLGFVLWFFRDPDRTPPRDPDVLVSPADGRIVQAGPDRVSVFMNVFDVHVCRAPAAGRLESVDHVPGRFLAAYREPASEQNERVHLRLRGPAGPLGVTLVAGLIARRIVCKVAAGQQLATGQRLGLIRFGSRVDVDLPPGAVLAVARGDRVLAGRTCLARVSPPDDQETAGN